MDKIKACPNCGKIPRIRYACGEYFVVGGDEMCWLCSEFTEMHATEQQEIEVWNQTVDKVLERGLCPFDGNNTNDCEACIFSDNYHYFDGNCVRRDNNEISLPSL